MKTEGLPNHPSPTTTSASHSPPPANLSPEIQRLLPEINSLSKNTIQRPTAEKAPPLLGKATANPQDKDQFIQKCNQAVLKWNKQHPTGPKINPDQEK